MNLLSPYLIEGRDKVDLILKHISVVEFPKDKQSKKSQAIPNTN